MFASESMKIGASRTWWSSPEGRGVRAAATFEEDGVRLPRWFPVVGWAERGGGLAGGHGNSVPRFRVTWG